MLKAIQILGASSTHSPSLSFCLPHGFKKPYSILPLISRKPPLSQSSTSLFFASQFRKPAFFRAFQMSQFHSESTADSSTSTATHSAGFTGKIKFCQSCGSPTKYEIPDGEEKMRAICTDCRNVTYENPKMVVGCLIEHENKILLCKRKIPPSYGLWTLPAGFMEIGESAAAGAIRETWEEAGAEVEVKSPFVHLDIPHIGHTYLIFLAKLKTPNFTPGPESLECQFFALEDIPFDSLSFSSMLVTLKLYMEDMKMGRPRFHYGIINKWPGSGPSDIHAHTFDHHFRS